VLKKGCGLDPLNDTAFNNLGLAYFNLEKYQEAIESYEKSISLNDKIAHRFVNLGLAYDKLKNHEKAAMAFENSTKIHANPENLKLLAKSYLSLKDKKLAKGALERLLEEDPGNSWAKRQLAAIEG
jgi:tetratricopeptide (TPR) repeat protein